MAEHGALCSVLRHSIGRMHEFICVVYVTARARETGIDCPPCGLHVQPLLQSSPLAPDKAANGLPPVSRLFKS